MSSPTSSEPPMPNEYNTSRTLTPARVIPPSDTARTRRGQRCMIQTPTKTAVDAVPRLPQRLPCHHALASQVPERGEKSCNVRQQEIIRPAKYAKSRKVR